MVILAFLQNQWFRDPEGIEQMFKEKPERRNRYIQAFLFMGCLTGRRLKDALGEQLCDDIIWEEASPKVGGRSSSLFPADLKHICSALITHRPDIVLAFGKIAVEGVRAAIKLDEFENHPEPLTFQLFTGPHPAARTDPMPRLREIADRINFLIHDQNVQDL
jgi:hypothetical protein